MTMTLISTVTLSSAAASIDFTSIPQTGTDLFFVLSARDSNNSTSPGYPFGLQLGGASNSYTAKYLRGDGSASASASRSDANTLYSDSFIIPNGTTTANTFGNIQVYIPNYTSSTTKSFSIDAVGENNATAAWQQMFAGSCNQTTALTSVKFVAYSTPGFVQYSTASLYMVTKGSGGASVS